MRAQCVRWAMMRCLRRYVRLQYALIVTESRKGDPPGVNGEPKDESSPSSPDASSTPAASSSPPEAAPVVQFRKATPKEFELVLRQFDRWEDDGKGGFRWVRGPAGPNLFWYEEGDPLPGPDEPPVMLEAYPWVNPRTGEVHPDAPPRPWTSKLRRTYKRPARKEP